MEIGNLVGQTVANALGTLIALGVVYLIGVAAGAFTFQTLAFAAGVAAAFMGIAATSWSARQAHASSEEIIRKAKKMMRDAEHHD